MAKELDKQYSPQNVEDRTYKFWCDHKYFHAEVNPDKKPYTIVIPPPNITGQLHMGHALDETLQDILIRWRRMEGYETLWLPGTDHASSVGTQADAVAHSPGSSLRCPSTVPVRTEIPHWIFRWMTANNCLIG